jgi:hypothetical protein
MAPKELIDAIQRAKKVFIKTENYVTATVTLGVAHATLAETWPEDRLADYLEQEAKMNHERMASGGVFSIFVGDAAHFSWVLHYHVRYTVRGIEWQRVW